MTVRILKWGNSLAVRIPKSFAEELGVSEDSDIDLALHDKTIVIAPKQSKRPSLREMVAKITPENRHEEYEYGPPVGKELL